MNGVKGRDVRPLSGYVTRLGDGLLVSYEMIELMSSADMIDDLKRARR